VTGATASVAALSAEQPVAEPLLDVHGLTVELPGSDGDLRRVVDGLDLTVAPGERVALVLRHGSAALSGWPARSCSAPRPNGCARSAVPRWAWSSRIR
jgi:hypothetical protein